MVPPHDVLNFMPIWVGVYLALIVTTGLSSYALFRRVIMPISLGSSVDRFDKPVRRVQRFFSIVVFQKKVLQRLSLTDRAGVFHAFIFWGFLSFLLSYIIFIFGDSAWRPFSETLLTDVGVKVYASYLDVFAVIILVALIVGVFRRWVMQPHRLTFDLTRSPDAVLIVGLIGGLMMLTLLTEAFYTASGAEGPAAEALVGSAIGKWFSGMGLSEGWAGGLQETTWWLHTLIILGFGVYIPFSKHMHMMATPINALANDLGPRGRLPFIDLENAERFGAGRVQDFTWKELLDGYACAVCGRCTDVCPANISGKILSPMHIVENLKDYLIEVGPQIRAGQDPQEKNPLIGNAIQEEALWDCVTCGACVEECPVVVEHVPTIINMRRYLVMEQSSIPETGRNALTSIEQRGHPWRGTQFTRTSWAEGLDVPTMSEHPDADVLLWVGCTPALEARSQAIARSMVRVLKRAGIDFAILGDEETCTGDPARRMGHEYLYQIVAKRNIETLNKYSVKKIVTLCPHCLNTIKNEYPQLGGSYQVQHYAEFVDELIKGGEIKLVVPIKTKMVYHDPCYLGRYNQIYDAPREVAKAIPGLEMVEMERNRERSFCCGAGGGHMWLEESGKGRRINHVRTDHFLEAGGDTLASGCPFCLQMFKEGIEAKGVQGSKRVVDLLELVVESLGEDGGKDQG
jgi:Fe-S oxidoreductase